MVAVAMAAAAQAGEARPEADFRVPVYMDNQGGGDFMTTNLATAIASKMFRRIGVTLIWVNSRSCPPDEIRISLTGNTPATLQPRALAYALPYEGTHIRVFLDRIETEHPDLVPHLLAYVMVHEIIHIVQGCARHSESGVMKARWNGADFSQMRRTDLPIAQIDIDLVHRGIETRARLAAAHRTQGSMADNLAPALAAPTLAATR
jgi:hypothetical protein